ncbi:tRNA (adenosine(37)-N6)-threonylcarbamoyltransferase complex dimerization subunit type 1 TsaB [candidate division KSB3 bacterium]|uniref:tRNA (Adenosine(37)-N6)-threonylcarbamoyltransferase complex dimerization subunit type 1 TsaB n=1 Tax=candidate division KSB3 bacterium TaxID=2044937 RepID=A0A9D5JZH5_9BACT|nr:tRNA (adenosine(37)-N6)-threonylcarbamoyltransferase complex dimerization subunit type 1 TsaB [candidate division KSB3 bacterium]MBD3327068.1 tRNA (adenosine(37)-N6)-threonylcarbamoyltransferase complex dimerization subunit type 1 TsaB [candidate division KSB3 bacterium]
MHVLGIDTSTMTGSVAILTEDRLIAEYTLNSRTTHTERLLTTVDQAVQAAGLTIQAMDGIAVTIGPGSFTGLRIGVTTAKSLAYSLQKPIVGIPSLDALASHFLFSDLLICPILDARKHEVYTAFYRNTGAHVHRLCDYAVIAPEKLLGDITEPVVFLGDGVVPYRAHIESMLGASARFADPAHLLPRASLVAKLGLDRLRRGDHDECFTLTPLYIRKSDAEIHWENKKHV